MSRKPKSQHLLEKSVQAAVSAIEIYSKPDFKYREESFCILMVNAWELLLKAKILHDNKNDLKSIYVVDENKQRNDGKAHKKVKYKTNRVGNYFTVDIHHAINLLKLNERLKENINLLIEMRDNAIHFYNESKSFEKKVLEIGMASLESYVKSVNEWLSYDFSRFNFYVMPMTFFPPHELKSLPVNEKEKQQKNLLEYIASVEKRFPSDAAEKHNISLILDVKFVRSKSSDSIPVKIEPKNPDALPVKVDAEEQFRNKYLWSYKDELVPKLRERYQDFRFDQKYRNLMSVLREDKKYCDERFLDSKRKKGVKQKFYSSDILTEFDKHYQKK